MQDTRLEAAEAYVQALRTGDGSAAARASRYLAADVALGEDVHGHDEVLRRITGEWAMTSVYAGGAWSDPEVQGDRLVVRGEFGVGAAPASTTLTFTFDGQGLISRIEQENVPKPAVTGDKIPDFVKSLVNNALANKSPLVVAYTDADGQPVLSLRGSTQVYSDTQLSIWVRNAEGGLVKSIQTNPRMSLLYRDSAVRNTLNFVGRGHVEPDDAVRRRVYELAPEVEQNHDPGRKGAALIIDVDRLQGLTTRGAVRFARER